MASLSCRGGGALLLRSSSVGGDCSSCLALGTAALLPRRRPCLVTLPPFHRHACHDYDYNYCPSRGEGGGTSTSLYQNNVLVEQRQPTFRLHQTRFFGVKRVVQKRRHAMKLLHLKQTKYEPKPHDYRPLPLSLLGSGVVRRLINAGTQEAMSVASTVDWEKYKSDTRGVRWHPNGSWRVQFDRRNYENNFFVKCDCYFRVSIYGFEGARRRAIAYRRRLEVEWDELTRGWQRLEKERELQKLSSRSQDPTHATDDG